MVMTVIWKAVSTGLEATRFVCGTCQTDNSKKCSHEVACETESLLSTNDDVSSDEYEDAGVEGAMTDGEDAVLDVAEPVSADRVENGNLRDGEGIRCVNEVEDYLPKGPKRSFMYCAGERGKMLRLTDLIESLEPSSGALLFCDPNETKCGGITERGRGNRVKCNGTRKHSRRDTSRRCMLETLNHGSVGIIVVDWECSECQYENRYVGYSHGIFSASAGVSYTAEIIYFWISEMCNGTRAFRSVYNTTNKLHHSTSYSRRYVCERMWKIDGWHNRNRRLGNDAVRQFIRLIDLDSRSVAGEIFTCPKCEDDMEPSDYVQLGMNAEENCNLKRIRSVVIDAKVVGLLKDDNASCDRHDVLTGAPWLKVRMLPKRPLQDTITIFVKTLRNCILKVRNKKTVVVTYKGNNYTDDCSPDDGYMVRREHLFVRLQEMRGNCSTKGQKKATKLTEYMSTIRFLIDGTCCICMDGSNCLQELHHDKGASEVLCAPLRCSLQKREGRIEASYVMRVMFRFMDHVDMFREDAATRDSGTGDSTVTDANRSEEDDDNSDNCDEHDCDKDDDEGGWVVMRFGKFFAVQYLLESFLEVTQFCLTEPVTLGFFPYQGWQISPSDDCSKSNGTCSSGGEIPRRMDARSADVMERCMREKVKTLAKESIDLHLQICRVLLEFARCDEDGRTGFDWVCPDCVMDLSELQGPKMAQNPVLGRFINDTLSHGERHPVLSRQGAGVVEYLIHKRVEHLEECLDALSAKMHESSLNYWKNFGHVQPDRAEIVIEAQKTEHGESNYVFTGRENCRTAISFEKVDKQACTKNYAKGSKGQKSAITSFFTVQCACEQPRIFGFVVLNQCKSISAALSAITTHFPIPPRNIWYDNACNTYDSGMLRIPWLLRWSRLLVDRFHYTGHNCSNIFNGDLHNDLDADRSVAAEVINSLINKGASHISYLEGKNVKPFMKVVFAYVNACAAVRDKLGRDDLEDDDVERLIADTCIFETCTECRRNNAECEAVYIPKGVYVFTKRNELVKMTDILEEARV